MKQHIVITEPSCHSKVITEVIKCLCTIGEILHKDLETPLLKF